MKRRLDDCKTAKQRNPIKRDYAMKYEGFRDCIILQRLSELYQFSSEDKESLHKQAFANLRIASQQLQKFKNYLQELKKQSSQKIPREHLREFFGGKQENDIIIPGTDDLDMGILQIL